jgi:catechol 2,3-dioxygenase-like lactoylglutathione lyase family enzyme
MDAAVSFYTSLGFEIIYGGPEDSFTSFQVGDGFLNLQLEPSFSNQGGIWGRVIFWVDDVDEIYGRVTEHGLKPETEPADAPWGERYFHIRDPDGHELSIARPL